MANNQGFDPLKSFNSLRETVGKIIEDGISNISEGISSIPNPLSPAMLPVDVYETETAVVVKAGPIVGVKPEAIDVSLAGDTLTIKGEIVPDEQVETNTYLHRERKFGTFSRSVAIPRPVKADQASASYKDGILTITLPKHDEPRPKVINVKPEES